MTTIASTSKALGADSMVFVEGKGLWYPAKKILRVKAGIVGAAGDAGDCVRFMEWAKVEFNEKKRPKFSAQPGAEDEAILLMLTKDGIHFMSTTDPYPELVAKDFYAIGSGGKAAMGALYSGKSLEDALDIAHAVDPYTRPPFDIEAL